MLETKVDWTTFVREWVKDLRSGQFTQTQKQLADESVRTKRCCLGVACYTAKRLGITEKDYAHEHPTHSYLPPTIQAYFDISDNPRLFKSAKGTSLAQMNDMERLSFEGIADAIEEEWLSGGSQGEGGPE